MKTHQELFNIAVSGVIRQGRASMADPNDGCLYETNGGTHCGVGHILKAAGKLDDRVEGTPVLHISETTLPPRLRKDADLLAENLKLSGADPSNELTLELLIELQQAHDSAAEEAGFSLDGDNRLDNPKAQARFISLFKERVRTLARRHGLDDAIIDSTTPEVEQEAATAP